MSKELRTAVEGNGWALFWLGESYLGLGETDRGIQLVRQGLEVTRAQGQPFSEANGHLILARVLLASSGASAMEEVAGELAEAMELARKMEFRILEPLIHVEQAKIAQLSGDTSGHQRELREAHSLFIETGATGHADRIAGELEVPASQNPSL